MFKGRDPVSPSPGLQPEGPLPTAALPSAPTPIPAGQGEEDGDPETQRSGGAGASLGLPPWCLSFLLCAFSEPATKGMAWGQLGGAGRMVGSRRALTLASGSGGEAGRRQRALRRSTNNSPHQDPKIHSARWEGVQSW